MAATSTGAPNRRSNRNRTIAWLGFIVLLLSLLAPQLSNESAEAAQTLAAGQAECDEGFVLDERTGECKREPQRVPGQIVTECPDGTVHERETGACIPVTETAVPETETPVVTETATDVPETATATEVVTEPPAPLGYAQAIKRACPEGFVPDETTTVTELQNTCLDPVEDVGFQLLIFGVLYASVPTDATGLSQLGSAPVGEIALAEEIPAGYGEPIVYCAEGYAFGPFEHTYTEEDRQPVLDGNSIAWTLPADTLLQCYFYNIVADDGAPGDLTTQSEIEAGEGADVTVVKHRCPLGVPEDTTLDQYLIICPELLPEIGFTLEHAGGSLPGETGEDGQATWPGVQAGEIAIQEDIPAGYKDPLAFCVTFAGEQELASGQVTATGGLVPLTIPEEATSAVCWLFNLQDETLGSITIQKWICPPGYEIDTMVEDPLDSCTDPGGGVTFTIDDGNPPSPDQTQVTGDDQGTVVFAGLEPGTHTVTEEVPGGIEQATGWCASVGQVQALDNPPRLVIDLAEGEHWVCDWLNVPDDGQPEVNSITVDKWRCPLGIPVDDFDQGDFANSCTDPHEEIDFTLETGVGSDARSTDENGEVAWEDIAAGPFSIQEAIPAGYLDPYVYCTYTPEDENAPAMQWAEEPLTGGLLELEMGETADHLDCHWYNVPDENTHSLTIHKWECPAGFDENVDDPETHCTTPLDGVTFTLGDMEAVSGDAGPGTALFTGIPSGEYGLTEVLPDGFERAFYGGCLVNGQGVLVAVGGGNVPSLEIGFGEEEAEHWECDWYNVPHEPEENEITIRKWVCPIGASHDEDQGWYEANCIAQHDGVTFNVTSGAYADSGATVGGAVVFEGVPAGNATIEEPFLAGFGAPVVFCGVGDEWTQYDASNPPGDWQHDFPNDGESEELFCYAFNIPTGERTVVAIKYICPAGLEPESEDFLDWFNTCGDIEEEIEFTLADSNGETTSSPDLTGQTRFEDVAPGEHSLTEHTPPGFQPPIVFCTQVTWMDNGIPVVIQTEKQDVTGSTVSRTIDEPAFLLVCAFFNVPIDPEDNGVEIHKWQCPEGTDPGQTLDWYEDTCTDVHNGVEFTVTSDIGIALQETAGGTASFPGLPAGTVGIQETIPDGFGPPVVFCAPDDSLWAQIDVPTGYWEYAFVQDGVSETLVCYVFNIPGEPPSITIHKWTCPPGYDLDAAGANPKLDCAEATDGITFELRYSGHDEVEESQVTGDVIAGGVIFDDLQPDNFQITELVPPGIASVFVLECTGHIMGALQPYPLSTGNVLDDIDLDAGEHLVCDWYNVPDDGGKITVAKHICATETFVSEVDCEVYEGGATFDLLWWDGAAWQVIGTETTDGFGLIVWSGLDSGDYWLDEHDGEWCHIATYPPGDENAFAVDAGEETLVDVYNCDPDWTTTTVPEKYPNTGVPPAGSDAAAPYT